jgi:hypothetical protein
MVDRETISHIVSVMIAASRAIIEARRIPEGHLYAAMMNALDLQSFNRLVGILIEQGICKREGHELVALIELPANAIEEALNGRR